MWGAFGVLVFGLVIIMHWALAMFTDTGYGEFAREISSSMGDQEQSFAHIPRPGGLMFVFGSVTWRRRGPTRLPSSCALW